MPESALADDTLATAAEAFGDLPIARAERRTALERFRSTASGRERPGRYWKLDADILAPSADRSHVAAGSVEIRNPDPRVVACDLLVAAEQHAARLAAVLGSTGVGTTKFGALATAFARLGALIYVPAGMAVAEPIEVRYVVTPGAAAYPTTLVWLEAGAHATVIERLDGGADAFVAATCELRVDAGAELTFAGVQRLAADATLVATRAAVPQRDATVIWSNADLGAALSSWETTVTLGARGADAQLATIFFPVGTQHVEAISSVDHAAGDATSETLVKSAAAGRGQARYLGNIRIAAHAQGTDASLRDDALLLSKTAHIDSVPALEIAANDVRAYHGATVGAIDDDEIFYMQSRGIERQAAERMIALGFFEPALARFPTEALRDELRSALAEKVG